MGYYIWKKNQSFIFHCKKSLFSIAFLCFNKKTIKINLNRFFLPKNLLPGIRDNAEFNLSRKCSSQWSKKIFFQRGDKFSQEFLPCLLDQISQKYKLSLGFYVVNSNNKVPLINAKIMFKENNIHVSHFIPGHKL